MANFSPEVIRLAQESQAKYGVPASVTLAQYATESGYGTSYLAKNANNYFGMIASKSSNNKIWKNDRYWQVHDSMADSFDRHGQLLSSGRYAEATKGVTDAYAYIDAIQPIYAPESDGNTGIAALWKQIISDNNLTQYDSGNFTPVAGGGSTGSTSGGLGDRILSAVIQFVAVAVILVFAVVLFMGAFDITIPNPKKAVMSNV